MLTQTLSNITGYSKTIQSGDIIVFDRQLRQACYRVGEVVRRDFNGSFDNPEDAINNHFDASITKLTQEEIFELDKDDNFKSTITKY